MLGELQVCMSQANNITMCKHPHEQITKQMEYQHILCLNFASYQSFYWCSYSIMTQDDYRNMRKILVTACPISWNKITNLSIYFTDTQDLHFIFKWCLVYSFIFQMSFFSYTAKDSTTTRIYTTLFIFQPEMQFHRVFH